MFLAPTITSFAAFLYSYFSINARTSVEENGLGTSPCDSRSSYTSYRCQLCANCIMTRAIGTLLLGAQIVVLLWRKLPHRCTLNNG